MRQKKGERDPLSECRWLKYGNESRKRSEEGWDWW